MYTSFFNRENIILIKRKAFLTPRSKFVFFCFDSRAKLRFSALVFPAVLLDHVGQFNNELALLVFLARLVSLLVFPTQNGFTTITVNIGHCV